MALEKRVQNYQSETLEQERDRCPAQSCVAREGNGSCPLAQAFCKPLCLSKGLGPLKGRGALFFFCTGTLHSDQDPGEKALPTVHEWE